MRCAERLRQRGAAVILAMLTVALAAGIAAAVIGDFGHSLESVSGRHDQAQARLLARGAVDWARNVLAQDRRSSRVDHLREPWAVKVPPTPVEEGEIGGELQDHSGRFNLNALAPSGVTDPAAVEAFARLLVLVGQPAAQAAVQARQLADWIDADSVSGETGGSEFFSATGASAPNAALVHAEELLTLPGFDTGLVDRLLPFVTAAPTPSKVNVNTAAAELLAALLPDLGLDRARVLVAERERAWFKDLADFTARLPDGSGTPPAAWLDVGSRYFVATGRARFGVAVVNMEVFLDRRETWPEILWQRIL